MSVQSCLRSWMTCRWLMRCFLLAWSAQALEIGAHEFWLAPSTHRASEGDSIELNAMIGHGDQVKSLRRRSDHLSEFRVYDGQGHFNVGGKRNQFPTGRYRTQRSGLHVFRYLSQPLLNTLPADRFQKYLKDEGLDDALSIRRSKGGEKQAGRERYLRFAKSLVQVGDRNGSDRVLGLPLEIVAITNPFRLRTGSILVVRVLQEGLPIPGVMVKGFALKGGQDPVLVRTDGDGYARIPLAWDGRWMLNAVWIEPLEDDVPDADWESYWASLTFEIEAQ